MHIGIYSIHDSKAQAFLQPFFSQTDATAKRSFEAAVNTPEHGFSIHPSDYTLFGIADFDDQTGVITPFETLNNLGLGVTFILNKAPTNIEVA